MYLRKLAALPLIAATVMAILAGGLSAAPAGAATIDPNAAAVSTMAKVVRDAKAIEQGHKEKGWNGGAVPYSWGGGHGGNPGPSLGTCVGYTGSIHPCPATHTKGVDCSGFTRWVYALAFGRDVFGSGNTNDQIRNSHMHRVRSPQPGDLAFYGSGTGNTHHVGIYIGNGKMIDALRTGTNVETDSVNVSGDLLGYWHYS